MGFCLGNLGASEKSGLGSLVHHGLKRIRKNSKQGSHWDDDKQCYAVDHGYVTLCTIPLREPCLVASASQTELLGSSDITRIKCMDIMLSGLLYVDGS
jgi:hypothetical protein